MTQVPKDPYLENRRDHRNLKYSEGGACAFLLRPPRGLSLHDASSNFNGLANFKRADSIRHERRGVFSRTAWPGSDAGTEAEGGFTVRTVAAAGSLSTSPRQALEAPLADSARPAGTREETGIYGSGVGGHRPRPLSLLTVPLSRPGQGSWPKEVAERLRPRGQRNTQHRGRRLGPAPKTQRGTQ